ncbi:MAG: cbb3-type cytochrome c oxidase subunit 3 [Burkholderiales bacterium]|nr:cbb3-type cytochrome c oxidase subunit 3 [Burkholderiales bacterium]
MDLNVLREVIMVLGLAAFCGVVWWAYGPSRRERFERAAISILEEDTREQATRSAMAEGEHTRKG